MTDLVDLLAPRTSLRLLHGRIDVVSGDYHDIAYNGGIIPAVSKLDGTALVAGDYVAFLVNDTSGALILGKQTLGTPPTVPGPAGSPIDVDDNAYATYDSVAGTWTASSLLQSPTQYGCWFHTAAAFAGLSGMALASFELQLVRASGGPPEFFTHRNLTGTGALDLTGDTYSAAQVPVATATFVKLPLDWGHQIIAGSISGIGIGGGMNTGAYTGGAPNGVLRLTPV